MKSLPLILTTLLLTKSNFLFGLPVSAQTNTNPDTYYQAPSSIQGKTVLIPANTTFEGRINSSIGSSISRAGQAFTITMSSPVLANGVDVLIPAGSEIMGEVVEAIPHSRQEHYKNRPKPKGKLRVQITGLKMPDGVTYPLVASITGEAYKSGRSSIGGPPLGGVGYVGTPTNFEAVAPGMSQKMRATNGRGPAVVTRDQMMRDPLYGSQMQNPGSQRSTIRSLVVHNLELYIYKGSPLSIRLDAPFKIGFNTDRPNSPMNEAQPAPATSADQTEHRFSQDEPNSSQLPSTPNPTPTAGTSPPNSPGTATQNQQDEPDTSF